MAVYQPAFRVTNTIIDGLAKISEQLGRITVLQADSIPMALREEYQIRNVYAALAIDEKTLTLDEVRAYLLQDEVEEKKGKEIKNAMRMYRAITQIDPLSLEDLNESHLLLMDGVSKRNGTYRTGEFRVYEESKVIHVTPPSRFIPLQLSKLMDWYRTSEIHPLVKSAVFRFEMECIHPFSEGNARVARLWHRAMMGGWKELFYFLPIEEWILKDQERYYLALGKSFKEGDGNAFVSMYLGFIQKALEEMEHFVKECRQRSNDQDSDQDNKQDRERSDLLHANVLRLLEIVGDGEVTALDMMHHIGLKHRPTFRKNYLNPALESGALVRTVPDKPNSKNQKYKKSGRNGT